MPRRTIIIDFGTPVDRQLLHRIGNLQCDLFGEFLRNGKADMDHPARVLPQLRVVVRATRHLGSVMKTINAILKRHNLHDLDCVSR